MRIFSDHYWIALFLEFYFFLRLLLSHFTKIFILIVTLIVESSPILANSTCVFLSAYLRNRLRFASLRREFSIFSIPCNEIQLEEENGKILSIYFYRGGKIVPCRFLFILIRLILSNGYIYIYIYFLSNIYFKRGRLVG